MAEKLQMTSEEFRESMKDSVAILTRLSSLTSDVQDLLGMLTLAVDNDAQLNLLMKLILDKK